MLELFGRTIIICKLGMKHAIYTQHFRGLDEELFSYGMKDHILQSGSGAWYITLVSVLAPIVNQPIATIAAMVADLNKT